VAIRPSTPYGSDDEFDADRTNDADRTKRGRSDGQGPADGGGGGGDPAPWTPEWQGVFESHDPPTAAAGRTASRGGASNQAPTSNVEFHADPRFMWIKFIAAVIFIVTPIVASSSVTGLAIGLTVGVGLAIYGLRDVVSPVRLAADRDGVTVVSGFLGKRRLAWPQIERVRLDRRARYGARHELLEIDIGDSLYFFSRYDLGMAPYEALDIVNRLRPAG
jgi:Bacterial PH domain